MNLIRLPNNSNSLIEGKIIARGTLFDFFIEEMKKDNQWASIAIPISIPAWQNKVLTTRKKLESLIQKAESRRLSDKVIDELYLIKNYISICALVKQKTHENYFGWQNLIDKEERMDNCNSFWIGHETRVQPSQEWFNQDKNERLWVVRTLSPEAVDWLNTLDVWIKEAVKINKFYVSGK